MRGCLGTVEAGQSLGGWTELDSTPQCQGVGAEISSQLTPLLDLGSHFTGSRRRNSSGHQRTCQSKHGVH